VLDLEHGISLTVGAEEGPVASRDALIVLTNGHGHGTGEDVKGEALHPLVPVALVELGAVWKYKASMSDERDSVTRFLTFLYMCIYERICFNWKYFKLFSICIIF